MYIRAVRLIELGISREVVDQKVFSGEWKSRMVAATGSRGNAETEILISTLPQDLQLRWAEQNVTPQYPERIAVLLSEAAKYGVKEQESEIASLLLPLKEAERTAWLAESVRMAKIVERYARISPKRSRDAKTGALDFVPAVYEICQETACKDAVILSRHPHRARALSPYRLDDLCREYREKGLLAFLPRVSKKPSSKKDKRWAIISQDAADWLNKHWSKFKGPRHLFKALKKEAKKNGWRFPSESWVYRYWESIPEIVKTYHVEGKAAYISKYEPYVPRDYRDFQALQVLCGDHSERDITVSLPDGSLIRPWLTIWYDLRTGLIWGWHLSKVPSSYMAGLAYADGIRNFGAQPLSRPANNFYSYLYTDRGRDYRSHNWDGKVIAVHKQAMRLDGAIEWLRVQRRVGIIDDLNLKHLLARARNPKEKPVERVHKVISEWERNTFDEYCGRDAKSKPDRWREMYEQHKRFEKGHLASSPFISFDEYRERLAAWIADYNSSVHERPTLGSARVVPLEEYKRLYTTRYEISLDTLAILLMKAEKRTVQKNGVNCFLKHWYYYHEDMSMYKGKEVEIRYSDGDYSRIWVVLPNGTICEATLITPTSLLNPNKQTLTAVRNAKAHERETQRNYSFYIQSHMRGETTEDRVARQLESERAAEPCDESVSEEYPEPARVHRLTYLDHRKKLAPTTAGVTNEDVAEADSDVSIFEQPEPPRVKEFKSDDLE
jgi:hypothetical protein